MNTKQISILMNIIININNESYKLSYIHYYGAPEQISGLPDMLLFQTPFFPWPLSSLLTTGCPPSTVQGL